ncbi:hypothetical protein [Kibdelosporangium aridum]|uniref:hypothetical protein n=1 Tax=Kibdelosporangium aridum TaxID=2030 RepID=UPI00052550C0
MLTIPDPVWRALLDVFATALPGHERVAYLDGVRYRDRTGTVQGLATTVTVPNAVTSQGNFTVSAAAMEQAGDHFDVLGLVRLAQVHTHGNDCVNHSWVDDQRAYSQRDGALSLVLPYHATGRPTLWQAGVHVREPAGWRRVTGEEINTLIRLLPGLIDHRSTPWSASPTVTKGTSVADSTPSTKRGRWPWQWLSHPARRT